VSDNLYLEKLVQRLISLDEKAFQEFALTFGPPLHHYFLRHGLPPFEAEDLAAECVTDIAMNVGKYHPGGNFAAWVYTIARNRHVDHWKRGLKTVELDQTLAAPVNDEPWSDVEIAIEVQAVLVEFSEQDRLLVLGRAVHNRSYEDLAEELGIGLETARVRYMRARKSLAERLLKAPAIRRRIEKGAGPTGLANDQSR